MHCDCCWHWKTKKGGAGYAFAGNYGTKGCYYYNSGKYKGRAYWGTGGSRSDFKKIPRGKGKYRVTVRRYNPVTLAELRAAAVLSAFNGDYIRFGKKETINKCERLLRNYDKKADIKLGTAIKFIQYSKQYCYYYGAVRRGARNAGKSGAYTWKYTSKLDYQRQCYNMQCTWNRVVMKWQGNTIIPKGVSPTSGKRWRSDYEVRPDSKRMPPFGKRTPSCSESFLCTGVGGYVLEQRGTKHWGSGLKLEMVPLIRMK